MPPVRNNTTPASGGSGTEKCVRSVEADTVGTTGSAAPTQQEAQVEQA